MSTKWYCCNKCKEVCSYAVDENSGDTTFPRGEWLTHGVDDFVTTGFNTKQEAQEWLDKELASVKKER